MQEISKLAVVCSIILAGCASSQGTDSLTALQEMKAKEVRHNLSATKQFRERSMEEAAIATGAQSGLAFQTKKTNAVLEKHAKKLDLIFNFQHMLLDNNVLCPVLVDGNDNFNLDPSGDKIRIADKSYTILRQATFVTTAPNWRQYLWVEHTPPNKPDNALLPITSGERKIWKKAVSAGWEHGVKQAKSIFKNNLNKLTQDFNGMVLYKSLLVRGMVSAPQVGVTSLGITGDNNEVRVNDQILRITALPEMQHNTNNWKPVLRP